jgi:hypothetical protein
MKGSSDGLEAGENPFYFESLSGIINFVDISYSPFSALAMAKNWSGGKR